MPMQKVQRARAHELNTQPYFFMGDICARIKLMERTVHGEIEKVDEELMRAP